MKLRCVCMSVHEKEVLSIPFFASFPTAVSPHSPSHIRHFPNVVDLVEALSPWVGASP